MPGKNHYSPLYNLFILDLSMRKSNNVVKKRNITGVLIILKIVKILELPLTNAHLN